MAFYMMPSRVCKPESFAMPSSMFVPRMNGHVIVENFCSTCFYVEYLYSRPSIS
jgi:hypothetical protein